MSSRVTVVHSAKWDDSVDLAGKRVAIIGTGATAVQLIPELAKPAGHLTVFQRTPIWVTPKLDREMPKSVQRLFARLPFTQRWARRVNTSMLELIMVAGVLRYRRAKVLNRGAERIAKRHLHRQVPDPELRRKLTPDYSFGCKRPTFSNDYYRAFTRAARRPRDHVDRADHPRPASLPHRRPRDPASTSWSWPPASTCGTPTSRRSRSSAAGARTSASGGARPASRPTRASPCRASPTCSTWRRRTPTRACRSSPRSRAR